MKRVILKRIDKSTTALFKQIQDESGSQGLDPKQRRPTEELTCNSSRSQTSVSQGGSEAEGLSCYVSIA